MHFTCTLNSEFKRVAKAERITMEELVAEVSALTGVRTRQIYNWRSGKWAMNHTLIPILCKRFRSRALAQALLDDCTETQVEIPDGYDLNRLTSQTLRNTLRHFEKYLDAFEDGVIDACEMRELEESSEVVIRDVRTFLAIALEDHGRRQRLQSAR